MSLLGPPEGPLRIYEEGNPRCQSRQDLRPGTGDAGARACSADEGFGKQGLRFPRGDFHQQNRPIAVVLCPPKRSHNNVTSRSPQRLSLVTQKHTAPQRLRTDLLMLLRFQIHRDSLTQPFGSDSPSEATAVCGSYECLLRQFPPRPRSLLRWHIAASTFGDVLGTLRHQPNLALLLSFRYKR